MKAEGFISQLCIQHCAEKGRCAAPKIRAPFNLSWLKARSSLLWISNFYRLCLYSCYTCQAALYCRISPTDFNRLICDLLKLPAKREGCDAEVPCEICWPVLHRLAEQISGEGSKAVSPCVSEGICRWELGVNGWGTCSMEGQQRNFTDKSGQWDSNGLVQEVLVYFHPLR